MVLFLYVLCVHYKLLYTQTTNFFVFQGYANIFFSIYKYAFHSFLAIQTLTICLPYSTWIFFVAPG